jgi:hypothetical protein
MTNMVLFNASSPKLMAHQSSSGVRVRKYARQSMSAHSTLVTMHAK